MHRGGIGHAAAPADKPGAIRLAGDLAEAVVVADHQMHQPWRVFVGGAGAAGAENGGGGLGELRLHEEIAEGGMGRVRRRCRQDHFRITGQLDDAGQRRAIDEFDAPQLHIIFGRDADFGVDFQPGLALSELRAGLGENGFVALRFAQGRLIRVRKELTRRDVTDINKGAPVIAGGIFAPAGEGQLVPATITAARAGDDDMVATVGQQMHLRHGWGGIGEQACRTFHFAIEHPRHFRRQVVGDHTCGGRGHPLL